MLEQACKKIREWLGEIYRPSQIERAINVRPVDGHGSIHFKIWTSTNEYRIRVALSPTGGLEDAYMGAGASTRKPRAGETWVRGNDLPDGKMSDQLWRKILAAIVRYEAQEIKSESWKEEDAKPGCLSGD